MQSFGQFPGSVGSLKFLDQDVFYPPTINPVTLYPPFVGSDDAFYSPSVPGRTLAPTSRFNDTDTFYAPSIVIPTSGTGGGWDSGTAAGVALSGSNLTATNTGTTSGNQGAHVVTTSGRSSGKYYFELTLNVVHAGANGGVGIGVTTTNYTAFGGSAIVGALVRLVSGDIWVNGLQPFGNPSLSSGIPVVGIAADLDHHKFYARRIAPPVGLTGVLQIGAWNAEGGQDPGSNIGGIVIPVAGTYVPFVVFGGTGGLAGSQVTANFGSTPFWGAPPTGFTAGWPK